VAAQGAIDFMKGLESLRQQDWIAYATRRDWNRQTK
jgi:hypothetical protein